MIQWGEGDESERIGRNLGQNLGGARKNLERMRALIVIISLQRFSCGRAEKRSPWQQRARPIRCPRQRISRESLHNPCLLAWPYATAEDPATSTKIKMEKSWPGSKRKLAEDAGLTPDPQDYWKDSHDSRFESEQGFSRFSMGRSGGREGEEAVMATEGATRPQLKCFPNVPQMEL